MPASTIQPVTYLKTFAALLGLLALTVGVNFLHIGSWNVMFAMLISVAKGALIVLLFMEARDSRPIIWLFASAGVIWLLFMFILMFCDYSTRSWVPPDWRAGANGSNAVQFAPLGR